MHRCKLTPVLLLMVLLAMESTAANAESRIGTTTSTRPDAEGIVGTDSQTLSPGSEVYANETVRTGNVGRADLVLLDNTSLNVGPASELKLDKFIYDKTGSKGSVVLQATRGALRFVTGSQDHRAYQLNTPYGSLGVRGTTVEVVVKPKGERGNLCPNGQSPKPGQRCEAQCEAVVRLVEGQASYTSTTGKRADLNNPGDVACITRTGDIIHSTSSSSILPGALAELTTTPFASPTQNPNGGTTTPSTSCTPSNTPSNLCP
jgi:FecR protein